MSVTGPSAWEVRTATGSNSNGGAFDPTIAGGTDYSQQGSAQATGTATTSGATCTATTGIFTSAMVGNAITNGTTWFTITAFTSSLIVTLNGSPGWTAQTINVGGAVASIVKPIANSNAGNIVWCAGLETTSAGYTVTSAMIFRGYTTTRYDGGKYTMQASANMGTIITHSNAGAVWENICVDGNSKTISATAVSIRGGIGQLTNFEIKGCSGSSDVLWLETNARGLYIHNNASSGNMIRCTSGAGISQLEVCNNASAAVGVLSYTGDVFIEDFLIYANSSTATFGISVGDVGYVQAKNGSIDGCKYAVQNPNSANAGIECFGVIMSNSGTQAAFLGGTPSAANRWKVRLKNCFEYNSTGASTGHYDASYGPLGSLSADPYVNKAGANFALSSSSAAYTSLKGIGFVYPSGNTTDAGDVGAAQSASAGSSTYVIVVDED